MDKGQARKKKRTERVREIAQQTDRKTTTVDSPTLHSSVVIHHVRLMSEGLKEESALEVTSRTSPCLILRHTSKIPEVEIDDLCRGIVSENRNQQ